MSTNLDRQTDRQTGTCVCGGLALQAAPQSFQVSTHSVQNPVHIGPLPELPRPWTHGHGHTHTWTHTHGHTRTDTHTHDISER